MHIHHSSSTQLTIPSPPLDTLSINDPLDLASTLDTQIILLKVHQLSEALRRLCLTEICT